MRHKIIHVEMPDPDPHKYVVLPSWIPAWYSDYTGSVPKTSPWTFWASFGSYGFTIEVTDGHSENGWLILPNWLAIPCAGT